MTRHKDAPYWYLPLWKVWLRSDHVDAVGGRYRKITKTPVDDHALFQISSNYPQRCFVLVSTSVQNFNIISYIALKLLTFPFRGNSRMTPRGRTGTERGPRPRKLFARIRTKVFYNNYEGLKKNFFIGLRLDPKMLGWLCTTRAFFGCV